MTAATHVVTDADRAHLARAVVAGRRALGRSSPNPAVGCVLVSEDRVVATGWTAPAGGPHAEVLALRDAGGDAAGSTAFVTLEPCAHHGRTPPCSDALRDAGVARVVIGHPDPNRLAAGGATALRAAGIQVDEVDGHLRAAVAGELEGFLRSVEVGRPHLTLKLAQARDGALRAEAGRWLTGPSARRAVHRWRAAVDAVLVGSGTVVADDPSLDVRDAALHDRPQPRPVVLDARLRTPPSAQVVARGALVLTAPDADDRARAALTAAGAEVVTVPSAVRGRGLDLAAATRQLFAMGVTSVLAEPGATLAAALLTADVVDRLVLHVAVDTGVGPTGAAVAVTGDGWRTTRLGGAGPDLVWERTRVRDVEEG